MEPDQVVLWKNPGSPAIPSQVANISELVHYGIQLSEKEQRQIIRGFNDQSYEMVASYIWSKTISSLKNELSKMGVSFIAELLDRPDINEDSNLQQAVSELEAIRLAEELGIISGTAAFRLRSALDTISHFSRSDLMDDPENDLSEEEAKMIIRSCIQGILAYKRIEAAIDFRNFRRDLEEITLQEDNPYIINLYNSPYFFYRTTVRILLSLVKTNSGARLENCLANANTIIPKLWENLKYPERYQVGRSYSELFIDGQTKAASGLRNLLLKVKGFDFVPEDLRSSSFIKAANDILKAHEGMNNFYNEPAPTNTLLRMGSIIPMPAFSICMTAVLSVKLGNRYGVSDMAQESAKLILKNVGVNRWVYYFNQCLQGDERILYKLTLQQPSDRWIKLFSIKTLDEIIPEIKQKEIIRLLNYTKEKRKDRVMSISKDLYEKLGYATQ